MALEVPDDIVRELQDTIRATPVVAPRIEPVDVWANMSRARRAPLPQLRHAQHDWRGLFSLVPWFIGAGAVIVGLLYVTQYGSSIKGRVIQQGSAAIGYLVSAKDNLEQFNLESAQADLQKASAQFKSAYDLIPSIPGIASLRNGKDLLHAGSLLSDAGTALGDALAVLTNNGGVLNVQFTALEGALTKAQSAVEEAGSVVDDIDAEKLPEQYREQFTTLRERLPAIRALVDRAVNATVFLSRMTGADRPHRYIVLFSNPSELRPTGGFPGSYGLLTFENGKLKDFRADDIYNPDGQIRDLVVPPLQLQHITPSWGMRDAAWWADFPTSAKKVMEYWQLGGGAAVDGVLSIKPDILAGILEITGPISLPKYNLVLTSENVLATLQLEVESNKDAAQPKQIIVDLAPQIMERLAAAPVSQWIALLGLFKEGLDARDIIMHFTDAQLERFVASEGWNGAVKQTSGDYLMVNVSNIKGAKADAVTDTSVKLESWLKGGVMMHRLTLTRQHNGGSSAYGFYNKTNYSWVRVLVPEGSMLRSITGNSTPAYKALMDYSRERQKIVRDADLEALEATYRTSANSSITYGESGKTGFGFWMAVPPGESESVQLEYEVPAKYAGSDYHLYVQHQPGLSISDFEFTLQKSDGMSVTSSQPELTAWPDSWRLSDTLSRDLDLSVQLK